MQKAARYILIAVACSAILTAGLAGVTAHACAAGKSSTTPERADCPCKYLRGEAMVVRADGTGLVAAAIERQCADEWILVTGGDGLPGEGGQVRVLWSNPFAGDQCTVKLYRGTVYQTHCGVKWIALQARTTKPCYCRRE